MTTGTRSPLQCTYLYFQLFLRCGMVPRSGTGHHIYVVSCPNIAKQIHFHTTTNASRHRRFAHRDSECTGPVLLVARKPTLWVNSSRVASFARNPGDKGAQMRATRRHTRLQQRPSPGCVDQSPNSVNLVRSDETLHRLSHGRRIWPMARRTSRPT